MGEVHEAVCYAEATEQMVYIVDRCHTVLREELKLIESASTHEHGHKTATISTRVSGEPNKSVSLFLNTKYVISFKEHRDWFKDELEEQDAHKIHYLISPATVPKSTQ